MCAQKKLFKEWIGPSFTELHIDSDQISKITLRSEPIDKITIYTRMEGETIDNNLITITTTENVLSIGTDITPFFEPYNDKLAAHKVLAIEMIVIIPEDLSVTIRSKLANIFGSGHINYLETELETGFIELDSFEGNAILFSKWGSIKVRAIPGVSGTGTSVNGAVVNSLPRKGNYVINAASSHGAIVLLQTKK
jgi:hypothetical protein